MTVIYTPTPRPSDSGAGLPKTASDRAELLISIAERLLGLGADEATARTRRDFLRLRALGEKKQKLALGFEELGRQLRLDQDGLKTLDSSVLLRLRGVTERMRTDMAAGAAHLHRQEKAQKTLVDFLVGTVNEERLRSQSYPGAGRRVFKEGAPRGNDVQAAALNMQC